MSGLVAMSNSASGTRRRAIASPSPPTSRRKTILAASCSTSVSWPYAFSASRPTAPLTPPVAAIADSGIVRPSRRSHSSTSAVERSGRPPGRPATSSISRSTSAGSTVSPAPPAGPSITERYSSRPIGPTRTWLTASRVREPGLLRAPAVEVGPQGEDHRGGAGEGRIDQRRDERRPRRRRPRRS